jgi:hypothetical protein
MKKRALILAIAFLLVGTTAWGATIQWVNPTLYTDNTVIPDNVLAKAWTRVKEGPSATGPWSWVGGSTTGTTTDWPGKTFVVDNAVVGRWYSVQFVVLNNPALPDPQPESNKSGSAIVSVQYLPPIISTASLPGGTVGTAYSQTLTATSGKTPYAWSIASGSFPPGLVLNASTGAISGTPTTAGAYAFSIKVSGGGATSKAFSITIVSPAPTVIRIPAKPGTTIILE